MNNGKIRDWLKQHALVLEEGFCDSLRSIAEEYKTRYGYGTLNEVYRLLGISRQQVTYWKANPCSTQTKKRYFTVLEAAELFCLSDEAAELLANKAGLSLQGEQEENTGVQKLFKQYTDKQKKLFTEANVTERMLYYIKADRKPSKESLLALVISMGMETEEIQQVLRTAGYVLSKSLPTDMIVLYFLEHQSEWNKNISLVWQINEVLVAIMLNYIMRYLTSYFVHGPLKDPKANVAQTVAVNENYMLTKLVPKTQLTTALLLALVIAVLMYFFFKKTRTGFNIRAVGENRLAAQASGIAMSSTIILTMAVSGGLAALTGVTEVLGKTGKFVDGFSPGYGFTGIAVAVLGRNNPAGVLLSALLFGIMDSGAMKMSYVAGVSSNMIKVMQGLVILFVATPNLVNFLRSRKGEEKSE